MSVQSLLHKIGDFFTGLFASAKKTWKHLSPEVQNALLHGSGVVDIINSNIDKTPAIVIEIIQKKFPDLTLEKLHEGLAKVADALKLTEGLNDPDLETLITHIKAYLEARTGKVWAAISHTVASLFAIATAPADTKFAVISSLLEYVYHDIIKGK